MSQHRKCHSAPPSALLYLCMKTPCLELSLEPGLTRVCIFSRGEPAAVLCSVYGFDPIFTRMADIVVVVVMSKALF